MVLDVVGFPSLRCLFASLLLARLGQFVRRHNWRLQVQVPMLPNMSSSFSRLLPAILMTGS
jgi:hypothetical protein